MFACSTRKESDHFGGGEGDHHQMILLVYIPRDGEGRPWWFGAAAM
jgi:hypothetical protein